MEKLINGLKGWLSSLTAQDLYVIGVIIGSILATIGITAWIKRDYLRKNARKLASEFIVLNVTFWSFLSTVAGFVVLQGAQYAHLLPWLQKYWPTIMSAAIATHAVATGLQKFWKDRKDKQPLDVDALIDGIVDKPGFPAKSPKQPIPAVSTDIWKA